MAEPSDKNGAANDDAEETPPTSGQAAPAEPLDPLAEAKAETARFKEQWMRSAADFDNFRKRSRKELEDTRKAGREELLKDLLPVFDNLERAASSARPDADVAAIATGIKMVLKLFEDTLSRVGGKRIVAVGTPFDPNVHEAIAQVESAEHAAGTIAQEFVPGYQLGERLLRPAMVAVSKGPPSAEPAPTGDDDTRQN
ncbi:MAG TPA: nucleotide exchange factor GrpE [Labilithrix sp.]|nr:nucleotide exchange factor GrpE [Labilithrix sp.]